MPSSSSWPHLAGGLAATSGPARPPRGSIHRPRASFPLIPGDTAVPPKSPKRGTRLLEPHTPRPKLFRSSGTRGGSEGGQFSALHPDGSSSRADQAQTGDPGLRRTPQPVCTPGGLSRPAGPAEVGVSCHREPRASLPATEGRTGPSVRSCPSRLAPATAHPHRSASSRSSAGG